MSKSSFLLLLAILLLSACQVRTANVPNTGDINTSIPDTQAAQNLFTPTPQPTPLPSPTVTATPLSTEDLARSQAAGALQSYFAALEKGDVNTAAQQLSIFSLEAYQMTAEDAAAALNTQRSAGTRWSNLQVLDSRIFDAQTVLVHVHYSLTVDQANQDKDELWPMRLENGAWHYNWNNLIDFHTLTVAPQTTAGVTAMPTQLRRFTDHLDLILLFQNHTSQPVVFGQSNEILATFHFGDKAVQVDHTQIILDALRSKPDVTLTVSGLWMTFPDSVVIRQWKNYNVPPWYTFNLE
jgi:hypothetical protein